MKCAVCSKEIEGEYFQANADRNLKEKDKGDSVCSTECAREYEKTLVFLREADRAVFKNHGILSECPRLEQR